MELQMRDPVTQKSNTHLGLAASFRLFPSRCLLEKQTTGFCPTRDDQWPLCVTLWSCASTCSMYCFMAAFMLAQCFILLNWPSSSYGSPDRVDWMNKLEWSRLKQPFWGSTRLRKLSPLDLVVTSVAFVGDPSVSLSKEMTISRECGKWDRIMDHNLPINHISLLRCCGKEGCPHPLCETTCA